MVNTEDVKKIFEDLQTSDPKIKTEDNSIILTPNYLNYVFILNSIPGLAGIYILTHQIDFKIALGGFYLIGLSLYGIFILLPFSNKIIVNIEIKTSSVIPDFFRQGIQKKKIISFKDVQNINFYSSSFGSSNIRYIIKLLLKGTEQVDLISTAKKGNANKIVDALLKIV